MTQEQEETALVAWVNEVQLPGKLHIDSLSDLSDGELLVQLAAHFVPGLEDCGKILNNSNAKSRLPLLGDLLRNSQWLTTRANGEQKLLEAVLFGAVQGPHKDEAVQCMLRLSPTNQRVFMAILEPFMEGGNSVGHVQSMNLRRSARIGGNHFTGMHVDRATMDAMYIEVHELTQEMNNAEKRCDAFQRVHRTEQATLTKITDHLNSVSDASIKCDEELREQENRCERLHDKLSDMKKELNDAKMNLQNGHSCHQALRLHIMTMQKSVDEKHEECNHFRDHEGELEAQMQHMKESNENHGWKRSAMKAKMVRLVDQIHTYDRQLVLVHEAQVAESKKTAAVEARLKEAQQQLELQSQLLTDDIAKTEARQERFDQMEDELEKVFHDLKSLTHDNIDHMRAEVWNRNRLVQTTEKECERQQEELKRLESELKSLQGLVLEHTRRRNSEQGSRTPTKEHPLRSKIEVDPKPEKRAHNDGKDTTKKSGMKAHGDIQNDNADIHPRKISSKTGETDDISSCPPKGNGTKAYADRKVLAEKQKLLEDMNKSQATLDLAQQDSRTLRDELSQVGTSLKNESTAHEGINQHIQKFQQNREQILEQTRALEQAAREQSTKFALQRQMFEESLVELTQAITTESHCASQVAELSVACEGTDDDDHDEEEQPSSAAQAQRGSRASASTPSATTEDDQQRVDGQQAVEATDDVDKQQLGVDGQQHQQVAAQKQSDLECQSSVAKEAVSDAEPKQSDLECQSKVAKRAVSDVAQVQEGQHAAATQGTSEAAGITEREESDAPQRSEEVQPEEIRSVNRVSTRPSPSVMRRSQKGPPGASTGSASGRSMRSNRGHKPSLSDHTDAACAAREPPVSADILESQISLREKELAYIEALAGAGETRHQREAHLLVAMLHRVGMRYGRLLGQCEVLSEEMAEAEAKHEHETAAMEDNAGKGSKWW